MRESRLGESNPQFGVPHTEETKRKVGEGVCRARERGCYPWTITKLHKILQEYLYSLNIKTRSEVRFGRYCVDEFDPRTGIAYEADGDYWHGDKEREKRRDEELIGKYGLKSIIHLTESFLQNWSREIHNSSV
jgi:hypothetical protein